MFRQLSLVLLCGAVVASIAFASPAAARLGSSAPAAPPSPGGAAATLEECRPALAQTDRSVTFAGEMTTMIGARRMAVRVDLLMRAPGSAFFHGVPAPGLGVWRRSAPDVQIYRYVKQVVNLPAPADFRAVIGFRWFDARGHVIRQGRRHTAVCSQPDQRPLLRVGHVGVTPASSGAGGSGGGSGASSATYAINVQNDGRGAAAPFTLQLTVNGARQPDVAVTGEAAFSRLEVDTNAPRCTAGSTVTVTLDNAHQLDEAPGGGQPYTFACPLAAPAAGASGG